MIIEEWVNGVRTLRAPTEAELAEIMTAEDVAAAAKAAFDRSVDIERDRRIVAAFTFAGRAYDFDAASKARITGMATLAGFALGAGAEADDLRWHGGDEDFHWIASDNGFVPMDAPTCFAFGQAAAAHEAAHIFAARSIKDSDPAPEDITDDSIWP